MEIEVTCFPKCQLTFNRLQGIISQKIELFVTTAVRTSNSMDCKLYIKENETQIPHPEYGWFLPIPQYTVTKTLKKEYH
jgi:hypothetical protein